MANPDHVKIVKQGPVAVANWRARHPGLSMDLRKADLAGVSLPWADLAGAHLAEADLRIAKLKGIDLGRAHLSGALLTRALLSEADFRGADLSGTELIEADLEGSRLERANLSKADLHRANFFRANLSEADLSEAALRETVFAGAVLAGVKGLESVHHGGPSVIDESALRGSWPLPEVFLRGCGLSDQYIEYLPSLMGRAIEFYSCFISYSSKDDGFAKRLHADLQDQGVRCWFAPQHMKIGDRIRVRIDESIRLHDKLLLILSEHSVASGWVEQEVETALAKERKAEDRSEARTVLFPIRLDDAVMESEGGWAALVRNTRQIGDFTRWKDHDAYQQAFERLLRDLKSGAQGGRDGES